MTAWEVKDYLSYLTGWETDEEDKILSLCKASLKEIEARLKADADRTDARIAAAAAATAYYKLILKRSGTSQGEEVTSFSAGDVSITQSSHDSEKLTEKARALYKEALESIIPLCADNSFAFENVLIRVTV